uniref:Oxidoreductase n=4 Tax=unclassified Streptomyces TaxID=2593676 RepID=D7EYX4_9ACTN|nr:oxidoreductase [Streptomyces sp. 768]ADI56555.1 oxidoreductase [Streptomyces sp. 8-21]ADI56559.1 oxidoreductase [Streptomyces sp. 8-32]ADI56561.1 oxidoreductase [Streptomyces sp. 8-33]
MTPAQAREHTGRPVRVAVVGLGWAGRTIWLPRLRRHPAFEVVAVVDPSERARTEAVSDAPGARSFAGLDGLSAAAVDLAVIAVPNHLHAEVASRLLAEGTPVFVEKPVCLDSDEAARLARAEESGGAVLLSGSAARHRADVRALRGLTASLGPVRHIEVAWIRARGVPDAGGWFTRRTLAGGGALVDLGWHLLDTALPLVGDGIGFDQVVGTVSGDFLGSAGSGAAWRHPAPEDRAPGDLGDVEDTARGFLVADNGVSVALRASWASHERHDVTLVRVEGAAGTATLRCTFGFSPNREGGSRLTLTRDGRTEPVPVADEPIGAEYVRQLDELPLLLADPAVRGRAVAEVRLTIGAIERLYRSARNAGRQAVPAGHGAH